MALAEAVANGITHGNRKDPARRLLLRGDVAPGIVRASVTDEGSGFDARACADPTTEEGRRRAGGRGLFLTRRLADRVRYEDGGSRVDLVVVSRRREGTR